MPSTLFRYLMRSYLERFVLVLLIVIIGLLLSNTFDTLNRFRSTTFTLSLFTDLVSLKLPYLIIEIIPLIGFISTLFFLHNLSKTNQLTSIWATGSSIWSVLLPVVISGIFIGCLTTCLLQPVASLLIGKYDKIEAKLLKKNTNRVTLSSFGVMIAEDYNNERRVITANSVDTATKELHGVTILFIDDDNNFMNRLDAKSALLDKEKLILRSVKNFNRNNEEQGSQNLVNVELNTGISIDRFTKELASPEHVSFWQLPSLIEKLHKAGIPSLRYTAYYYKQLFKPLMMMTVCFMAFCFISPKQSRVSGLRPFFFGILVGFVVYLMSEICSVVLMHRGFDIIVASLCPILVIISLSIFAILHLHETG